MTPSEIADRLEAEGLYQAADTIRAQAEALKIATEALKKITGDIYDEEEASEETIAIQALARIKEVV